MNALTFQNPVFTLYVVAATLMIAKSMSHAWLTVHRLTTLKAGYRLPEDLRRTPLNPNPHPDQLKPNEAVERTRRMHQNELENVPFFLAAGLLWVCTGPRVTLAAALFGTYVVSRLIHFAVIMAEGTHDARATAWTVGSLVVFAMTGMTLVHAVRAAL